MINLSLKTIHNILQVCRTTLFIFFLLITTLSLKTVFAQESEISSEVEKAFSTKILTIDDVLILHNINMLEKINRNIIQDSNIIFDLSEQDMDSLRVVGIKEQLLSSFKKRIELADNLARIRSYIVEGFLKGNDLIIVDGTMNNHEYNDLFRQYMVNSEDISEEVKREIKVTKIWKVQTEHGIETMPLTLYPHNFGELTIQETIVILKMYIAYSKKVSSKIKLSLQEPDGKIGGNNLSTEHINTLKKLIPVSNLKNIFLMSYEIKKLIYKGLPLFGPAGIPGISWPKTDVK